MTIQGLPDWAKTSYACVERKLVKPEVAWKFDWNFPHFDNKYSSQCESYLGLDETLADQALDQPDFVKLKNQNGTEVTASGDAKSGYYVEAATEKCVVARFSENAVDHFTLSPDGGCEWMHVDRKNTGRSFQLLFQVDPTRLEVESLTSDPRGQGVSERDGAVVVGGTAVRKRS
ncbi:MAG: hypothetical protein AMXMBFR33_47310 [Candidatus Xenobia bacterium]